MIWMLANLVTGQALPLLLFYVLSLGEPGPEPEGGGVSDPGVCPASALPHPGQALPLLLFYH
jgi:hypothetical protein